jgi:lipid-binding SYLF domain-containing protein
MSHRSFVAVLAVVMMLGSLMWVDLTGAQQVGTQQDQDPEKPVDVIPHLASGAVKVLKTQMTEKGNKRIPQVLRKESKCVVVFPSVVKTGLIVAVKGGQGLGSCRNSPDEPWSPPALFNIAAGSVGLQAGIQSASIIMLVTNQVGVDALLKGKVQFGSGIMLAAGPVGGSLDLKTQQPFLSYARTKGLFAGVDLEGAKLSFARESTAEVYGKAVEPQEILFGTHEVPESLKGFHETLQSFAP